MKQKEQIWKLYQWYQKFLHLCKTDGYTYSLLLCEDGSGCLRQDEDYDIVVWNTFDEGLVVLESLCSPEREMFFGGFSSKQLTDEYPKAYSWFLAHLKEFKSIKQPEDATAFMIALKNGKVTQVIINRLDKISPK